MTATALPEFNQWRVETTEDAVRLIRAQIERLRDRHVQVFIPIPDVTEAMKRKQRNDYTLLMLEYGVAVGLIEMAHKSGKLPDAGYKELRTEAARYTMPGVVGVVGTTFGG